MKNRVRTLWYKLQADLDREIGIEELANEVGLSRQTINTYMKNQMKSYNSEALDKLCRYFKVSVGELLYNDPEIGSNNRTQA